MGSEVKVELTGVVGCLSETYAMHLQADGSYQHDSAYPAVFTSDCSGAINMVVFEGGRASHTFRLRFGPDTVGQGTVTCMPSEGVELECEVEEQEVDEFDCEDGSPCNGGYARRYITVESMRLPACQEKNIGIIL